MSPLFLAMKKILSASLVSVVFAVSATVFAESARADAPVANPTLEVPVVWDSPSADSRGSMPIGNGDIGANVWVEPSGDLVLLLSKTDSWDEVSRLLKLGRLRIKLPSVQNFRQELRTADGEIRITADGLTARVWIDANRPVVRVEMDSTTLFTPTVVHETWRTRERLLKGGEIRSCWGQAKPYFLKDKADPEVRVYPDTVLDNQSDRIVFFHRNPTSVWAKQHAGSTAGRLHQARKRSAPEPHLRRGRQGGRPRFHRQIQAHREIAGHAAPSSPRLS